MELLGGFPPTGINFDSATQLAKTKNHPAGWFPFLELLGGFEPPTSSLPNFLSGRISVIVSATTSRLAFS